MANNELFCAIAFNGHDSSVSYAINDKIVLVLEAERIFRTKKKLCNPDEMERLVNYGLVYLNKDIESVTGWTLCSQGNPWLNNSQEKRLAEYDYFWDDVFFFGAKRRCLIVGHHYSHACMFYFSPYDKATIHTCDGGGDFTERVVIFTGDQLTVERGVLDTQNHTTGMSYSMISSFIYKKPFSEGKLMALAGYGIPTSKYTELLSEAFPLLNNGGANILRGETREQMNKLFSTGLHRVNEWMTSHLSHLTLVDEGPTSEITDFVASFQNLFVEGRLADLKQTLASYPSSNLVLSGGACLNLEVNTKVWQELTTNVYIPPCCDDTGQSLGALAKLITLVLSQRPDSNIPFLGTGGFIEFSEKDIDQHTDLLLRNYVLLVHNGHAEIGPRALGHRSILARPDNLEIKQIVSEKIKNRESYRPVAPITTVERVLENFAGPTESPYMLFSYDVRAENKAKLLGCIHADNSARVQTVSSQSDPYLHALLTRYGDRTGAPVLLNTSLNLQGQPISNEITDTAEILDSSFHHYPYQSIIFNGKLWRSQ